MAATVGNISVQTENIFPIIKRFLYSDQEIFLRELVSNAVDATTKLQIMAKRGEVKGEIGNTDIEILLDAEAKTLTVRDRGIGMTKDEVEKYLNQVAFSGAAEFLSRYEGESGIIGFFGLGFYSAFMVASKVEVVTQSHQSDAETVRWTCEGTPQYTLEIADKKERGTDIILHISDDANEYLEESRVKELLNKYCKFLPQPILFKEEKINNPNPIWRKTPTELKEEDYKAFYEELYPMSNPPLFWIHLNIDYPFNLTGILYFPKLENNMENQRNKIQLYSNQVYVTDNVKDIVPEFLTLLHGVIDSPDIPLNVSRSYLQSNREVKQITTYITRKVADKLSEMFRNDRPNFESKWSDISIFVKYGMLSDEKFFERGLEFGLLKNVDNKFFNFEEYKQHIGTNQTNKAGKTIGLYTNDATKQDAFIKSAKSRNYDVIEANTMLDVPLLQRLENKAENYQFMRVDAETIDKLIEKDEPRVSILTESEQTTVKTLFEDALKGHEGHKLELEALASDDQPVQIVRSEFMRRMLEMQQLNGWNSFGGKLPDSETVVVNTNHPLVAQKLLNHDDKAGFAKYLYDLALVNQGALQGSALTDFVQKTLKMLA